MDIRCRIGLHKWLRYADGRPYRCCYRCLRKEKKIFHGCGGTSLWDWEVVNGSTNKL